MRENKKTHIDNYRIVDTKNLSSHKKNEIRDFVTKSRNDNEKIDIADIYSRIFDKKFKKDDDYFLIKSYIAEVTRPEYEKNMDTIDECLSSKKHKWNSNTVIWKQWEDVSQDIKIHFYLQWYQYDRSKPLKPWLTKIIDNQIFNIKRNAWGKFVKPCVSCDASLPSGMCKLFTYQSDECFQYAHWQKNKEIAYNLNNASSIDFPNQKKSELAVIQVEFHKMVFEIEDELKFKMTPREQEFYELYFVRNLPEDEVVEKMNLHQPTDGSKNKTIKNFEKSIGLKAAKILNLK